MKQTIFSKGRGWYISCTNYKDDKDKAYLDLFFPQNSEPEYHDNGRGFSVKKIDILESKFTSYKGKIGMTVFKYVEVFEDNKDTSKMGGSRSGLGSEINISQEELPFY